MPATRYGGPIRSVHGLCRALAQRGHTVDVFTTNVDGKQNSRVPLDKPVDIDGVRIRYFQSRHCRRFYYSSSLGKALEEEVARYDIVHTHSIYLWPTWKAVHVARQVGLPYVQSPRGMLVKELIRKKSPFIKTLWISLMEKKNLHNASAVHVTSDKEASDLEKFDLNLKRVSIIPNGIDAIPRDVSRPDAKRRQQTVLYLGRINWEKGLDRLVRAVKFVGDARFILAGNDEENYWNRLRTMIDDERVRDRIHYVGPVKGSEKEKLLSSADVLVLPSYSESFGIVLLEAMAVACPVIVTPEVGLSSVIRAARCGIVTEGTPKCLGEAISEALSDPVALREMGERGRHLVEERFTWQSVAKRMEELYKQCI